MSAECEKVFPAAGKIMVPERNRLKVEAITMCQILRSWFAADVIKDLNADLEPLKFNEDSGDDENSDDEVKVGGAEQQDGNAGGITSEDAE
jgi:hypothetical protein